MRLAAIVLVGVSLSLAACGKDPGPKGDPGAQGPAGPQGVAGTTSGATSGTRIKARSTTTTLSSADGAASTASYLAGWVDSARNNEACSPGLASDGAMRCLPAASAIWDGYYGDAACTIAIAAYVPVCGTAPPAYVAVTTPPTCLASAGPRTFAAGASYAT